MRDWRSAQAALAQYPPEWLPVGYAIGISIVAFFVFTVIGLWRMRRWALLARIAVHLITPVQMMLAWQDAWLRYPILGPFVGWFWFGVLLVCTLPYWERMTWRFP
ncbi:MAG TPA: hypothetical protein DHW63_10565 [Hyphomonadaceae bacterium]|nr:hypothetical protein [Hyphomonadaceae bacterium]